MVTVDTGVRAVLELDQIQIGKETYTISLWFVANKAHAVFRCVPTSFAKPHWNVGIWRHRATPGMIEHPVKFMKTTHASRLVFFCSSARSQLIALFCQFHVGVPEMMQIDLFWKRVSVLWSLRQYVRYVVWVQ